MYAKRYGHYLTWKLRKLQGDMGLSFPVGKLAGAPFSLSEFAENSTFNMNPNTLIWGARYDRVMDAFGGKGFFVEDPKDLKGALAEAMNHHGPALVSVVISQGAARKPQQFRWPN